MKIIKLSAFAVIVSIVTIISWIVGNVVGNAVTHSTPPPPADAIQTAQWFFSVCVFNALLLTMLFAAVRGSSAIFRWLTLTLYLFTIQFLLPQMETFFFASEIGITRRQASAILIAGTVVSLITGTVASLVSNKLFATSGSSPGAPQWNMRRMIPLTVALLFIGYPFLYLTFGYYVAWQNEALRVFYTESSEMASYAHQVGEAFANGIYLFQVVRAAIWVLATIPVVIMLRHNVWLQFLVVGLLSALLPTSLLFIPNPYMPDGVAMTHFIETSISNFVWGLLMVAAIRRSIR